MFRPLEFYKPNHHKTFRMMQKVYEDALKHRGGNVTFRALPPSDVDYLSHFDLTAYNYESDIEKYCLDYARLLETSFALRREIDDNMLPNVSVMLGIGDYSAFVQGEIDFRPDTSWSRPCLKKIDDWKNLPPLGSSRWYQKFLEITASMLSISADSGIPYMRGFFSPLDLAAALRGEAIYYDFCDNPDELHELLNYCAEATIRFAEDIYDLAGKYLNDTEYGMFFCRNIINLSEDIACMISGEQYREFCRPHTQKVIDHFGTGHMHTHSRSMYLVKEICSLNNVANLWLPTDPNAPRPIEHLEELIKGANGVCLAIDCERFEEIEANYQILKQGNFSLTLPCKSIEEALYFTEKFNKLG